MKNATFIGITVALFAAICYGFIPFFTLPLKIDAANNPNLMSDPSILFYRFGFAALLIGCGMLAMRKDFGITRGEAVTLIYLSFISDGSALFLIDGYNYMSSGVATTLHFMYPVVTALVMMTFYHEARRISTILAIIMAVGGVGHSVVGPYGQHECARCNHCAHFGCVLCTLPHSCKPFARGQHGQLETGVLRHVLRCADFWCRGHASRCVPTHRHSTSAA